MSPASGRDASPNAEAVVIIGSGPAGYTAALYAEAHFPLLIEGDYVTSSQYPGGQLTTTTDVDNFPGFECGIQGPELARRFREHALLGDKLRIVAGTVTKMESAGGLFLLHTTEGTYKARSVIVATGAAAKRIDVKGTGDDELWQKGISACATCDGWLFKDRIVAVIGGGDTAMEEVMYLSGLAKRVLLVHRRDKFKARPDLLSKVRSNPKVAIREFAVLKEARGSDRLQSIVLQNVKTGEEEEVDVDGLFFAIGHSPSTDFLPRDEFDLDSDGYLKTDPRTMETSVKGVFGCGDVQDKIYRQAITAAASGCIAALSAMAFLENRT